MNKQYISQKKILEYFNNNPDIKIMEVYISFVGNNESNSLIIIKPSKILLIRQKDEMVDCFGEADLAFNKIDPVMFPLHTTISKDKNNLYPSPDDIITHFDWNVRCYDLEQNNLDYNDSFMAKLKFFDNMKGAELNFVKMLNIYFTTFGINTALIEYNKIIKKYTDLDPSQLLGII